MEQNTNKPQLPKHIVILPCPFCGGKCATEGYEFGDNPTTYYRVNCENEHSLDWWEEDEQVAIQVWNIRHGV